MLLVFKELEKDGDNLKKWDDVLLVNHLLILLCALFLLFGISFEKEKSLLSEST